AQLDLAMKIIAEGPDPAHGAPAPYIEFLSQYNTSTQTIGHAKVESSRFQTDVLAPQDPDALYDNFDSDIHKIISKEVHTTLTATGQAPPANTIYVVYTPPGTFIDHGLSDINPIPGADATSKLDFAGYHDYVFFHLTINGVETIHTYPYI